MLFKFKIPVVFVAVLVCGIAVAGVAGVYQKNTSISYVINTSISDPESSASQFDVDIMPQRQGVLGVSLSGNTSLGTPTTPSTSISTSNVVIPTVAGGVDNTADVGHKSATESVVAEVDKVVIPVYTKDTVLSAMESYQDTDRDFSFAGTKYPGIGFFVETLRGIGQGDGRCWMLYVNDESSDLGASRTVVVPGDVVEWRLEASTY